MAATITPITDEAFEEANRRGAARDRRGVAVSVRFFPTARRLAIDLSTGARLTIPVDQVEYLAGRPADALRDVMLGPGGRGLHFPQIDVDLSVAGLMDGIFGSARWMAGERPTVPPQAPAMAMSKQFAGSGAVLFHVPPITGEFDPPHEILTVGMQVLNGPAVSGGESGGVTLQPGVAMSGEEVTYLVGGVHSPQRRDITDRRQELADMLREREPPFRK